jgi:hypothetical protein
MAELRSPTIAPVLSRQEALSAQAGWTVAELESVIMRVACAGLARPTANPATESPQSKRDFNVEDMAKSPGLHCESAIFPATS